jgi:hypothetical protein
VGALGSARLAIPVVDGRSGASISVTCVENARRLLADRFENVLFSGISRSIHGTCAPLHRELSRLREMGLAREVRPRRRSIARLGWLTNFVCTRDDDQTSLSTTGDEVVHRRADILQKSAHDIFLKGVVADIA